nr:hypothetical protein [Tanacetum cinerariifolium]
MSRTILPPYGASSGNYGNPNRPTTSSENARNPNRVEYVFQIDNTNNTGTTNVAELFTKWSPKHRRLANQDKRLKSIIISCIPNDVTSDSDVEEDTRRSSEFLPDLNAEFHDRVLLANQKRFYKRSRRVGSAIYHRQVK